MLKFTSFSEQAAEGFVFRALSSVIKISKAFSELLQGSGKPTVEFIEFIAL